MTIPVSELVSKHASFLAALSGVPTLTVTPTTAFKPITAGQLAELEGSRRKVPADLASFLSLPFGNVVIASADEYLFASDVFLDGTGLLNALETTNSVADELKAVDQEFSEFLSRSLPLQEESNAWYLDTQDGSVLKVSFDGEKPVPIAPDFRTALEHWLAAGCFSRGNADSSDFSQYWELVAPLVPVHIEPGKNLWLKALSLYYGNPEFPEL